jgi:hypothetical protein
MASVWKWGECPERIPHVSHLVLTTGGTLGVYSTAPCKRVKSTPTGHYTGNGPFRDWRYWTGNHAGTMQITEFTFNLILAFKVFK